jgi:OOP family OmpA-OmpF porin
MKYSKVTLISRSVEGIYMRKQLLLMLTGLLLLGVTSASAANLEGSFSVSPIIGGYTFDDKQHLDTNLVYGGRIGFNFTQAIGIEAFMEYVETDRSNGGIKGLSMYRYGGELLYHFIPNSTFVPYVAGGYAGLNFDGDNKRSIRGAFEYGVGAKYFLNDRFALRSDVRHIIYTYDKTYNNLEYTIGAYIPFGGVKPAAKPVEPVPEQVAAIPAPVTPPTIVAEPKKTPAANLYVAPQTITKGQSTTLSWNSSDASECVIQPAIAQFKESGSVDLQGDLQITPEESTSYTLTCRGDGGSSTSSAKITVNQPPQPVPVVEPVTSLPPSTPAISVLFDFDKSNIKPEYNDELNKLGKFLKNNPTASVTIDGYTDNIGSKRVNQRLSTHRSQKARSYLIKNFGIDESRITVKGLGFSKPVASNSTRKGRALNRRIEVNSNL